ncbi:Serine hydrolase FSH [Penicillium italicum]|uniref:Serine hydrolase FSH n=1 Tax=Penicillium italicum TaxID=40296 RepID=A0A0A2KY07_PENIT|nr:Serine hydrolase FSH [Penicillium italicum]
MTVRILSLHGMGTNARIFAAQTAHFRDLLPPDYEFVFVDGTTVCDPAPEVAENFEGPYLGWYRSPSTVSVAAAHDTVRKVIEEKGPFDAVLGFSQGAAVAASILLHAQIAGQTPPFQAAIFIGSPIPFSSSLDYGIDTRTYFGIAASSPSRPGALMQIPDYLVTDPAYLKGDQSAEDVFYQMFHATVDPYRIGIPTTHVYGLRDQWRRHSMDLVQLCDRTTAVEHGEGHGVPAGYSEEIADAVETVMTGVGWR